jgi:hypothetical protein
MGSTPQAQRRARKSNGGLKDDRDQSVKIVIWKGTPGRDFEQISSKVFGTGRPEGSRMNDG